MKSYIKRLPLIFMFAFLLVSVSACGNGSIKISVASSDCIGKPYTDIQSKLESSGFKNIRLTVLEDIDSYSLIPDFSVESVLINGESTFDSSDKFGPESEIEIIYHCIPKVLSPINSADIQSSSCLDMAEAFISAGFTDVSTSEVYDMDPDLMTSDYYNEVHINGSNTFSTNDGYPFDSPITLIAHYPYEKYDVSFSIDFVPNLLFNKYDVNMSIDGQSLGVLKHGKDDGFAIRLKEGSYTVAFAKDGSSDIKGESSVNVTCNADVGYRIYCYGDYIKIDELFIDYKNELAADEAKIDCSESSFWSINYNDAVNYLRNLGFTNIKTIPVYDIIFGITKAESVASAKIAGVNDFKRGDVFKKDVEVVITYHMPYEDNPSNASAASNTSTSGDSNTSSPSESDTISSKPVFYSTNDLDEAKNGNSGVYAYKSSGGQYDIYWIIDFDEQYVYYFTDGNGNATCDRIKMVSGDLNDVLIITYHDGSNVWSYGLHFKWKRQPDHLILQDQNGFEIDFYTTDLSSANSIKNTMTIVDY